MIADAASHIEQVAQFTDTDEAAYSFGIERFLQVFNSTQEEWVFLQEIMKNWV